MNNKTKRLITEEWLTAFPSLSPYAQNKLYKNVGPFIIGIELIELPRSEKYRPHFVVYSLYKKDLKTCLEYPVLMLEFYNAKKLQLNLPYDDVNKLYKEAQNIISKDFQISLVNEVALRDFYNLIDTVLKNDSGYNSHAGKIAALMELKFYAALYINTEMELESVIGEIKKASKNWNMQMLEVWHGSFDNWLLNLEEQKKDRTKFLRSIELNKQEKKISMLKISELVA